MKKKFLPCIFLVLLFSSPQVGRGASASSPRQFMNQLSSDARQSLKAGDVHNANLLFVLRFDMPSFGKLCLIDHWDEFLPTERDRFINLLDQNIRQEMTKRMLFTKEDADFKLTTDKIVRLDDGMVSVENTLKISKGDFRLRLLLTKNGGEYRIADYELEGALLSRNYRGHFNYLLRKYDKKAFLEKLAAKLNSEAPPVARN